MNQFFLAIKCCVLPFIRNMCQGLLITLTAICLGISLSGCNEVERSEPGEPSAQVRPGTANARPARALNIVVQDQSTSAPAKVSVSFRMETDTGLPVPSLPADSFELYENGDAISPDESTKRVTPEDGEFSFSTLLLIDFSGSVLGSLDTIKTAAVQFIEQVLPPASEFRTNKSIALAIFDGSRDIRMLTEYQTNRDHLIEMVYALDSSYASDLSTNLYGAVVAGITGVNTQIEKQAQQSPDRMSAGALVLFTDGTDQAARVSKDNAISAVNKRPESLSVMTIGLGNEINTEILGAIGQDSFKAAEDLNGLVETFSQVAQFVSDKADSFYKLEYCTPKRAGKENTLRIVAKQGELTGEATVVFSAESFESVDEGCSI